MIDVTRPVSEGLPAWPGDPVTTIRRAAQAPFVSWICMSSHIGTHVDPPAHYQEEGDTVDRLPLDLLIGPAWLCHLPGSRAITAQVLDQAGIPPGIDRLLLSTSNSEHESEVFDPDFVTLDPSGAQWLLDRRVRLVGVDGPSVEPYGSKNDPIHRQLLRGGMVIVEGLALAGVEPGSYELICLPLRILDGDGAPARVVLRQSEGE